MKKIIILPVLLVITIISLSLNNATRAQNTNHKNNCDIKYPQSPPGNKPEIFSPGIISVKDKNSHALEFSPDGSTIIFSRYPDKTSYLISVVNGKWSNPEETPFYGKEISFSRDGKRIYYYTGGDIYYVEKNSDGWSEPVKMSGEINTENQTEYYPCIVKSGSMYFSRNGKWNEAHIMHSAYKNGTFTKATDIGLPVNEGGASHAWVSPDESYMLFNSPREGSYTRNDIWVSFRKQDSSWNVPVNLGNDINSGGDAILCPTVSPDGKYLFFTRLKFEENSNTGYIYWVSTEVIDKLRAKHLDNKKSGN